MKFIGFALTALLMTSCTSFVHVKYELEADGYLDTGELLSEKE